MPDLFVSTPGRGCLLPSCGELEGETSPSAADLSRIFGFDLPRHRGQTKPLLRFRDCCARSIVSRTAGTIGYSSVQQKNPALWRGLLWLQVVYLFCFDLGSVYLFECLLASPLVMGVTIRYALSPVTLQHDGRCCVDVGASISRRGDGFSFPLCVLHAHAFDERRAL